MNKPGRYYRLRDLRPWELLAGKCFRCHHMGLVDIDAVKFRFPPGAPLDALEQRLCCTKCSNRKLNNLYIGNQKR